MEGVELKKFLKRKVKNSSKAETSGKVPNSKKRVKRSFHEDPSGPLPGTSDVNFAVEEVRPLEENDLDSDTDDPVSQLVPVSESPVGTSSSGIAVLEPEFVLLADLTLGANKKTIRVTVSLVTDIVHWPKNSPRGTVFSADVVDRSGDARLIAYNDLCDKFHDLLKVGQSVEIRSFTCRLANPRWKTTKSAFELLLTSDSRVEVCSRVVLPQESLMPSFTSLSSVNSVLSDQFINLVGIVVFLGVKKQVRRRSDGHLLTVRDAKLVDESLSPVTVTCWSDAFDMCESQEFPVLQVVRARTKKGSSVMVTVGTGTQLELNTESSRGQTLRRWWRTQDHDVLVKRFAAGASVEEDQMTFEEAERKLTTLFVGSSVTFWNHGEVVFLASDSLLYQGCSQDACSKKVDLVAEKQWFCSKCHVTGSKFRWKLSLRMAVKDETREIRCITFGQAAERLLEMSTEAISTFYETDSTLLQQVLTAPVGDIYSMRFVYRKNVDESAVDVVVTTIEVPEDA